MSRFNNAAIRAGFGCQADIRRRWRAYQDHHLLIATRVAEHDASGAAEAIRDHLNQARVQMLGTDA